MYDFPYELNNWWVEFAWESPSQRLVPLDRSSDTTVDLEQYYSSRVGVIACYYSTPVILYAVCKYL